MPVGDVHQEVDGASELSRGIVQRGREREKAHPGTVRPFSNGLNSPDGMSLFECHRHRALVVRKELTIQRKNTPRATPSITSKLRPMTPKVCRCLVKKSDAPLRVSRIDRHWQSFEQFRAVHGSSQPEPNALD